MRCFRSALVILIVCLTCSPALAQGGNFGEGAPPGFFLKLLLGVVAGLGGLIGVGLAIVRPVRTPPIALTGAVLGGLGLAVPITALAVIAMLWLEALWPGVVIGLGLGGGYVALMRSRWTRTG